MNQIYTVTITEYEDDWKHRYDNGVYPTIKCFKTKETAEKYLCAEIYDKMQRLLKNDHGYGVEDFPEELVDYVEIATDPDRKYPSDLKQTCENNLEILTLLHEALMKGEHVPYLFDFSIEPQTLED